MKTVILAEKPSQAKAYAETFQQRKRHEGYYEISDPLFAGEVTITFSQKPSVTKFQGTNVHNFRS